jgi:hypothetical protein
MKHKYSVIDVIDVTHMKQTNSRTTTESLVYSQAAAEVHAIAGNFIILEVTEIRGRVGPLKATLDATWIWVWVAQIWVCPSYIIVSPILGRLHPGHIPFVSC